MFLLDSDHLRIIQQRKAPEFSRLAERMAKYPPSAFYVSILSLHEQTAGWNAYMGGVKTTTDTVRAYRMLRGILTAFAAMQVLSFDEQAAKIFESLRKQHVTIATVDLQLASIALSHQCRLLSHNRAEFFKVPRLVVEDWTIS